MAEAGQDNKALDTEKPMRLRDAMRKARIEAADRTGVVVDLRDAEVARLEILNEALDPVFAEIPTQVELFDRGISQGQTPRLWIDPVAHVAMGRDKRSYRFVQDTRFGRKVLAESHDVAAMTGSVTDYIARRMIERDQAMVATPEVASATTGALATLPVKPQKKRSVFWPFAFGFVVGVIALLAAGYFVAVRGF